MNVTKFEEVWPRTPQRDDCVVRLGDRSMWRIMLAGLYLTTGRFMPDEAKRKGVYFGFCDADGNLVPAKKIEPPAEDPPLYCRVDSDATHVGWTVGE